jgi:hypothetical protein
VVRIRCVLLVPALAAAAHGRALAAQPMPAERPRAALLLGAGLGSTPDVDLSTPGTQTSAMHVALGARLRAPRLLYLDAGVRVQQEMNDFVELASPPATRYASSVRGRNVTTSADLRVGVEQPTERRGGVLLRAAVGGGYTWGIAQPYTAVGAGIGTRGRRLRLTLGIEHRWFKLPVDYVAASSGGPLLGPAIGRGHVGAGETSGRLGVEVPVWRR